ncbi:MULTISPECIES: DUF6082 family protein [unclassified Frankia]|uniref:DUF6082 family protein n=1 Tax=unclassified Frankia TaxID=2632575 RepID=UPI002AD3DD0B|nr:MULTISPECIES: DUF6082 family protein [unclassified Frankia]
MVSIVVMSAAGGLLIIATTIVPTLILLAVDQNTLNRWSLIGQAVAPVGVLYSGLALFAIILTLLLQRRDLHNQGEELAIALDEQRRSSEIALRALHVDLMKMALDDGELAEVWPPLAPGVPETRKDHYCNLILNLQKVAYEASTIEEGELRGALAYLMKSPDMYAFWTKSRATRVEITQGDYGEDYFTEMVDTAYAAAQPPEAI